MSQGIGDSHSKENYSIDLSFSSSFVSDFEDDPNLVLALDQIEQQYKVSDATTKSTKPNPHNNVVDQAHTNATSKSATDFTVNNRATRNIGSKSIASATVKNVQTPSRSKPTENARADNSFCDLSFASPLEISTPQIFKNTKQESLKKTSHSSKRKASSTSKRTPSRAQKTPDCTPRRSSRLSGRKKKVLKEEGEPKTADKLLKDKLKHGKQNQAEREKQPQSDFFKSLLECDDSLEESTRTVSHIPAISGKVQLDVESSQGNNDKRGRTQSDIKTSTNRNREIETANEIHSTKQDSNHLNTSDDTGTTSEDVSILSAATSQRIQPGT